MILLAVAALGFAVLHIFPATPLRAKAIAALGEGPYLGMFALASLTLFIAWIWAFEAMPRGALYWHFPVWWPWVKAALMLPVTLLFVCGLSTPNGTEMKGGKLIVRENGERGINAITRHPQLNSMGLWAVLHLISQPEPRGLLFFGVIALVAFAGQVAIDMRKSALDAEGFEYFAAKTSRLPFLALLQGRATLRFGDIGLVRIGAAVILWAALLAIHNWLFGASPIPGVL